MTLVYIIIATLLISLGAFVGFFFLFIKKEVSNRILLFFVSLSAGTLMGGAFIHLLPEAIEEMEAGKVFYLVLLSFTVFFLIEKVLYWRHCHKEGCEVHTFGYMNLIGDSVHNFIDGLIIAATFSIDIGLGITTTLAIAFHEIPQEVGDFGVLLYSGMKKTKALVLNFLVALTIVFGGIVGYFIALNSQNLALSLLPIAAGGFLYIATSDLIPEIRKEKDIKKSLISFAIFLLGIAIMYLAKLI